MSNGQVQQREGEEDLLVYTFRDHHNAHKEEDGSGAKIIRKVGSGGDAAFKMVTLLHGLVMMHYFLWFIPMLCILYIPTHFGYFWVSWIMLTYYLKGYYNGDELKRGRLWKALRQSKTWGWMQSYLDMEIVREAKLDPGRRYIFGMHPHGILVLSRFVTNAGVFEMLFPGLENRVLGATPMFNIPGSRELCLWMGGIRADKSNAVQALTKQNLNLILYPGGSAEIFHTDSESPETVIIARKGFIRLALQTGADLVPSFVFGEKHAYHKLGLPEKFKQFMMDALRTPLIIFWGKLYTWMPLKHDKFFLSVVYGRPIRVEEAIPEPSEEEVDKLYEQFYGDVQGLFEKYKGVYGYSDKEKLIIQEAAKEERSMGKGIKAHQKSQSNGQSNQ